MKPKVSVIIPTSNNWETIWECLSSIKWQTYDNIELIVVDDCSTDGTREIAQDYADAVIERESGMSEARNIGFRESEGDIVFFVDSDMRLRSDVVAESVEAIQSGADAVIVPEVSIGWGYWACVRWFKKWLHLGDLLYESPRVFRRGVVERVGGYDEELLDGEDYDMHHRVREAGARITYVSAVIEHMEGNLQLSDWIQKKKRYRETTERFREKHPQLYKRKGIRRYPKFLARRFLKAARHPHLAVGLFFLKLLEASMGR